MSNNKKFIIGLGGCATAGKDTFAAILENRLRSHGKSVLKIALAEPLKHDCVDFLKFNLGINALTQKPSEKTLIRPMLVWYGDVQRKLTNGRYWIDQAAAKIDSSQFDYYIVTDVRYDVYERDELHWIKNERDGIVCHVSRWSYARTKDSNGNYVYGKNFVQPANDHERENDPKIKAKANFVVEWESVTGKTAEELTTDSTLCAHVDEFIEKFQIV